MPPNPCFFLSLIPSPFLSLASLPCYWESGTFQFIQISYKKQSSNYQKKLWSHPIIPSWYICNSRHQIVSPRFPTYHLPAPLNHHTLNLKMCLKPLERSAKNLLIGVTILGYSTLQRTHPWKKYLDLIFTCIRICLISPLLFFSRISRGFSGCCLDSIKRPYLGMRGFCFIIQAKTSPACSINWNTSQVERDSASATELVMRTRPRAYSFDSYPCTGRPDVPEKLQRMTPHSSWNRASPISFPHRVDPSDSASL